MGLFSGRASSAAGAGGGTVSIAARVASFFGRGDARSLANPSSELVELFGGAPTAAGIRVTEESAQRLVAVYSCVKILAESVAQLPLKLYVSDGRGKREAREHPLFDVLHAVFLPAETGRRGITSFAGREYVQACATLRGTGYAQKVVDRAGRVVGLSPLRADLVTAEQRAGRTVYVYSRPDGTSRTFDADELFVLPGMSSDGITGRSPIQANREAIGSAIAADTYAAKFFGNGVHTTGVLQHPGTLKEDSFKRLESQMRERAIGGSRTMGGLILEDGMQWQSISISPEDAQALETRKFGIADIARIFRVPLHKLAELDRATFSNIEQQSLDFVTDSLMPWLIRWEQQVSLDLLTEADRRAGYFVKHSVGALLRGDVAARGAFYAQGRQWGWFSANDVREYEDLNPVEGGDAYLSPINMIPADQIGKTPAPPPDNGPPPADDPEDNPEDDQRSKPGGGSANVETRAVEQRAAASLDLRRRIEASFVPMFRDLGARIVAREAKEVRRLIKRHLAERAAFDFDAGLASAYESVQAFAERAAAPVLSSYSESIKRAAAEEIGAEAPDVAPFVRDYGKTFAGRHVGSSLAQLRKVAADALAAEGATPDAAAEAIEARLVEWEEKRPDRIAVRESVQAHAAVAKFVWAAAGVGRLVWRSNPGACDLCTAMDGKTVEITRDFLSAGEQLNPPGDKPPFTPARSIGHPPLHTGGACSCSIAPALF